MHLAAKALADSLSLAEIAKRTLLSVSFAFLIAWLIRTLLHLLAQEEQGATAASTVKPSASGQTTLSMKEPIQLDVIQETSSCRWGTGEQEEAELQGKEEELELEQAYEPRLFVRTALKGVQEPAQLVLPLVALMHSARTVSCAIQIALDRGVLHSGAAASLATQAARLLATVDNIFGSLTSVLTVIFVVWFMLSWRQHLVDLIVKLECQKKLKGLQRGDLEKVFVPISSLLSWLTIGGGILCSLQILGVNISPLLAVGGISGIAVGFGAQAVTSNAISAINLMLDRPFVVGEEVKLQTSSGELVVQGVVEEIQPMRTLIRNQMLEPIAIPNNMISDYIIVNESRLGLSKVLQDFADARQVVARVNVKYEDAGKLPSLLEKLTAGLHANPEVDTRYPVAVVVDDITDYGIEILLQAHATPGASADYKRFKSNIIVSACTTIAESGAEFAMRP